MKKRLIKKKKKRGQAMMSVAMADDIRWRLSLKSFTERILTGPPATRSDYKPLTPEAEKRLIRKTIKKIKFPKRYKWLGLISGPHLERIRNEYRASQVSENKDG